MRRKNRSSRNGTKQKILGLCLTLTAICGLSGVYYYEQIGKNEPQEEEQEKIVTEETMQDTTKNLNEQITQQQSSVTTPENSADTINEEASIEGETTEPAKEQEDEIVETAVTVDSLTFGEAGLQNPVQGEVLLPYSPDRTIYFTTLNQYQYNPAIVFSAEVNEKVYAAEDGIITDISTTRETGTTVTMSLGEDYSCVYGQVKELDYQVGDYVERGKVLGYVSEPTKYYTKEGANLYFQLLKGEETVEPTQYFQ